MENIKSAKELRNAIQQLESDQKVHAALLKKQYESTAESLKLRNLLVSGLREIMSSPIVLLFGIEKIKAFGHQLIDRFFREKNPD
ncbi:MAG: hypothetical protein WCW62_15840 [Bacteroidales bacterium]|jgi:hypothetical protein